MSDLMKNGNFLGQSYTILAGLNEVVEAMGSKDNLAKEVNHLGWTHFNRGVSTAMFEVGLFIKKMISLSVFKNLIQNFIIAANGPRHH